MYTVVCIMITICKVTCLRGFFLGISDGGVSTEKCTFPECFLLRGTCISGVMGCWNFILVIIQRNVSFLLIGRPIIHTVTIIIHDQTIDHTPTASIYKIHNNRPHPTGWGIVVSLSSNRVYGIQLCLYSGTPYNRHIWIKDTSLPCHIVILYYVK